VNPDNKNNVSVSYVGDLAYSPPAEVFMLERDEDYVIACHKLSQFATSDASIKIWVRSKNHFAWLNDFTEQIGCTALFTVRTALLVLAEQWNVSLPDWLTNDDVIKYGLLDMSVDSQKQTHFEYRLLSYLLGTAFQSDVLSEANLVDVIVALTGDDANAAFKKYPLLRRCLEAKCEQWTENSSNSWVAAVCSQLSQGAAKVWQWLSLWAVLHGYPEKLLEFVLTPEQVLFVRKIPNDAVRDLPLEPTAKDQMLTQIGLLFDKIQAQITSSDEFQKVLSWTSGRLSQEYNFISSIVSSNKFPPTIDDVNKVNAKFKSCPGVSENKLNLLIYCVKPNRPSFPTPEEQWSPAQWIQWTVEEYISYRSWQVHGRHDDQGLEQMVARFSDWCIGEYDSIHKDPNLSLVHCLTNVSFNDSKSEFTILLLIDCLPLNYFNLLNNALRNVGLSRHDLRYRFAVLPTSTEYNKALLLSGDWQNHIGNYEAILKARSSADWNGQKVVYLSNLKALSDMAAPQESTIAVLNLLDADEILHSDVESKNTTYEDELQPLFARMAESVHRLSQEWTGPREHFNVYVITDHGACRILEEEKRSFDSEIINKLFSDEKHRFAAVAENQLDKIPENLWAFGYRFKQPFTSDNMTFFLPKGHNTVRQAKSVKGYMHGGVTPEEVIVPTALYKLMKVAWKTLSARFLNLDIVKETGRASFYVQRIVALEIEIQNPNTVDISILRASVISPEADLKSCETVKVSAESVNTLRMNCYFKKDVLDKKRLEIEIAYEIAGEQHILPISLVSDFKSALSGGFSLKDL